MLIRRRAVRVPAVAATPPTIWSSAHCDLAVALARSCASATASCQEASPCSAAGSGAEGVLNPASEKMREDLWCWKPLRIHEFGPRRVPSPRPLGHETLERHGRPLQSATQRQPHATI